MIHRLGFSIEIDGDNGEAVGWVLGQQAVHPRKRLPARLAPGGPEIEVYNLALVAFQIQLVDVVNFRFYWGYRQKQQQEKFFHGGVPLRYFPI
jgi:hypothetical protein